MKERIEELFFEFIADPIFKFIDHHYGATNIIIAILVTIVFNAIRNLFD